ncbi:hypothetical protein V5J35_003142 [Endozoicomonas sp. NE40]|uniref:Uncharacterized protein n=1 Tax=Endozoicomonas lisbonensis TaxID=3120522 RepID=A0ABV2SJL4_9GAMM
MEMERDENNYDYKLKFSELVLLTISFGSIITALHFFFASLY